MTIRPKQTRTIDGASKMERSFAITLTEQQIKWLEAGLTRLACARHETGELKEVDQILAFSRLFSNALTPINA